MKPESKAALGGVICIFGLLILLELGGSGNAHGSDWNLDAQNFAKRDLLAKLRDPDSAVITNVTVRSTAQTEVKAVCGQVNARNGFGGYTGEENFLVLVQKVAMNSENFTGNSAVFLPEGEGKDAAETLFIHYCMG